MYRSYKHKLNMMEPGGRMCKMIAILCLAALVCHWFGHFLLRNLCWGLAGVVGVVLVVLLIVEQHEDRVLNAQAIRIDQKLEAGLKKESFVLNYNNGEIWCEHLDALGEYKDKVLEKWTADLAKLNQGTMPTLIAVNLDETLVDEELLSELFGKLGTLKQGVRKLVVVGLSPSKQRLGKRMLKKRSDVTYPVAWINDFEKAKEWLV